MSDSNSRPKNGLRGLFQSLAKRRPQFQQPVHAAPVPAEVPEIERLIPPEIIGDEFHALIERLAQTESLQHVLEIGSSAGEGSTSAFVRGLRGNPGKPALYCMELSKTRFEALSEA